MIKTKKAKTSVPVQTESLLFASVLPNLSQLKVSFIKIQESKIFKQKTATMKPLYSLKIKNEFIPTAPLGTRMAWTEPSGWLRAELRNSIWVEEKSSLRSVSWKSKKQEIKNYTHKKNTFFLTKSLKSLQLRICLFGVFSHYGIRWISKYAVCW